MSGVVTPSEAPVVSPAYLAALEFLALGLPPIPVVIRVSANHKTVAPLVKWGMGYSPTADTVAAIFAKNPSAGVAIRTGADSGLLLVDVDPRHGGTEAAAKYGLLPSDVSAPVVRTPGGGWHVYFAHPGGHIPSRSKVLPGVDVRADGGLAIAPPTTTAMGAYAWERPLTVVDGRPVLPPCPPWFLPWIGTPSMEPDKGTCGDAVGGGRGRHPLGPLEGVRGPKQETGTSLGQSRSPFLEELATDVDAAFAIARRCGARVRHLGDKFLCPLHRERGPSASLFRQTDGTIRFRDWHGRGVSEWLAIGELYAAHFTGKERVLNAGERAVWHIRAAVEAGVRKAPLVAASPLPESAPEEARAAYAGFRLLLVVRCLYLGDQVGAPFTRGFAPAWCGLDQTAFRRGWYWLTTRGFTGRLAEQAQQVRGKRTALYTLGRSGQAAFAEALSASRDVASLHEDPGKQAGPDDADAP